MTEDDEGYWWIATNVGVLRVPAGELDRAAANPAYRIRYESFNVLDGLPGMPQNAFPVPLVVQTKDKRIWIKTSYGIAYADPRRIPKNDLPPPVHVETVKVGDKVLAPADGIVLTHNMKDIEIDYTALSLSIPERVLFRYKLEGHDTKWQEPGTRRQAFYNDLRPGKYKFRVIACNNDGVWNEQGATLDFRVAPAWYQMVWFRASCVGGFVLLLWALYQLRLQQLQRQFNRTLEARVDERTRIARELHDTLLQSFNALLLRLQAVSNVLPAQPKVARERIDSAIEQASAAITEGRDAVLELRSGELSTIDLVQSIGGLAKELLRSSTNENAPEIGTQVEGTPRDLNPMVRDEAYRIAAEALRNALLHSGGKRIEVEIRYDEQQLRLRIRDDGKGIEPSVLNRGHLPGHWGLRGMRERAKLVGGNLEVWSQLDSGTEVELTISASNAYAKNPASRWSIFSRTGQR
jgi:signal transduction histidine kinase